MQAHIQTHVCPQKEYVHSTKHVSPEKENGVRGRWWLGVGVTEFFCSSNIPVYVFESLPACTRFHDTFTFAPYIGCQRLSSEAQSSCCHILSPTAFSPTTTRSHVHAVASTGPITGLGRVQRPRRSLPLLFPFGCQNIIETIDPPKLEFPRESQVGKKGCLKPGPAGRKLFPGGKNYNLLDHVIEETMT